MLMRIPQCIILTDCFRKFQWKIALWECCKHALLTWNSSLAMILIWCLLKLSKFKMLYVSRTTAVFYESENLQHHWLMKWSGSGKQTMQFFSSQLLWVETIMTKTHKNVLYKPYWNSLGQFWLRQFSYLINQTAPWSVPAWGEGILVWVVIDLQVGCK